MSFIPGMPFIGGASGGYNIRNSLRFRANNSAHLSRTPGTTTNRRTFTLSGWYKLADFQNYFLWGLVANNSGNNDYCTVRSNSGDTFAMQFSGRDGVLCDVTSSAIFRDPTAHYHFLWAIDSTQATASDRVKLYVNGSQITSFRSAFYPALNTDFGMNNTVQHYIGRFFSSAIYSDCYMSEIHFIDGQQLTPSSFGQTDPTTGIWVPKKYSGTYGTNGFYLPFSNAASTTTIGYDYKDPARGGTPNDWTSSGISVTSGRTFDQMTDTPTNNFPTLNFLDVRDIGTRSIVAAGLELDTTATGSGGGRATMALPTSGKWYWEVTFASTGPSGNKGVGLGTANGNISGAVVPTECITYNANGNTTNGGSYVASGLATYNNTNTIAVAYDAGANTVQFYKDNSAQGSAISTSGMTAPLFPLSVNPSSTATIDIYNFGQRPFVYTPPTGFSSLSTANLPAPTIKRGDDGFQVTLRTGTGATASVTSLRFQPDLVWFKSRSAATDHALYDAVRGAQARLESNNTDAEVTSDGGLTAFNANGYSIGTLAQINTNAATYVDWSWREGATYGFDIVTYTGDATAGRTVSHSLGAVPHLIIIKARSIAGTDWVVYHRNMNATPQNGRLLLNSNIAYSTGTNPFNSTAPTSSVFTLGGTGISVNNNLETYVAYLWTSVPGFSLMGSYTGNGSADGPFVWCGFKPRFVLFKRVDGGASNWFIRDAARNTTNPLSAALAPNLSDAESTGADIDFTAGGFKVRSSATGLNGSGETIIFAAFAEAPFKYTTAR